jgi:putative cell wall-binding protein
VLGAVAAVLALMGPARAEPSYTRLAGEDRYATAVAVSRYAYRPQYGGDRFAVTVTSGRDLVDALAAGPLATNDDGPVLLVPRDGPLPRAVTDELRRLDPYMISIAGGADRVSDAVEAQLRPFAEFVFRLAGRDRYDTAVAVAQMTGRPRTVFVATDSAVPDALGGAAAAGRLRGALVLTRPEALPEATAATLADHQPARVVVLGGEDRVSAYVLRQIRAIVPGAAVERWSGRDRYETAAAISRNTYPLGAPTVYLASGTHYADALAGAPAAARGGAPLLLTTKGCLPAATDAEIARLGATNVIVLGDAGIVGEEAAQLTGC